jgi:hypothetical protein
MHCPQLSGFLLSLLRSVEVSIITGNLWVSSLSRKHRRDSRPSMSGHPDIHQDQETPDRPSQR